MLKKDQSKLLTAFAKWDDTIPEKEVVEKFNVSPQVLQKYRRDGIIKNFRYVLPSRPGSKVPGKKPVYSITELTEIFCP